jgi:hypothetical protein
MTSSLLEGTATDDSNEATMRHCFHQAFEKEVSFLHVHAFRSVIVCVVV